ncbi:S41 family peptidase [Chitinophaga sp.]|uniref:S41 family peptidase n=1 Tax=Chitinophaga sp. TaxID=1869181 RepID=UPI00262A499E|nr:S41 family peptidase [uncultured Chitinophaga sp.]
MFKLRIAAAAFIGIAAFAACKKSGNPSPGDTNPPPTTPSEGTRLQLSLDSLYLFAKQTYLWYDAIPAYEAFNPRQYTKSDEFASMTDAMFEITQLKNDPATNKPYEYLTPTRAKFSYVEKGNLARGIKASVDLEGDGNDLGLILSIVTFGSNPATYLYVRNVEKGSPADKAGMTRGCLITQVNNGNPPATSAAANTLMNSSTANLTFTRPDNNTPVTVTLTKAAYKSDPVVMWKTFPAQSGNKTGYLVLGHFSRQTVAKPSLDAAFAEFAAAGVNAVVVDLRYNGGGYVSTAEYLTNLIAPSGMQAKVMYKQVYNELVRTGKATILKSLPYLDANYQQVYQGSKALTYADLDFSESGNTYFFNKQGPLTTVKKIVFIVTGSTASASELVINSFKAWPDNVTVRTVGAKTYGKPVGFFAIGIDKFTVYMAQFSSKNALSQGDYYAGMTPDIAAQDYIPRNFGDPEESSLKAALNWINTGATSARMAAPVLMANGKVVNTEDMRVQEVGEERFNGMVEDRRKVKEQ